MTVRIYSSYEGMIRGIFNLPSEPIPEGAVIIKCRAVYDKNGKLMEVIPIQCHAPGPGGSSGHEFAEDSDGLGAGEKKGNGRIEKVE